MTKINPDSTEFNDKVARKFVRRITSSNIDLKEPNLNVMYHPESDDLIVIEPANDAKEQAKHGYISSTQLIQYVFNAIEPAPSIPSSTIKPTKVDETTYFVDFNQNNNDDDNELNSYASPGMKR